MDRIGTKLIGHKRLSFTIAPIDMHVVKWVSLVLIAPPGWRGGFVERIRSKTADFVELFIGQDGVIIDQMLSILIGSIDTWEDGCEDWRRVKNITTVIFRRRT